ncbi:hypothetical protein AB1395_03845 [Streptococcus pluranimalium]|uniref:hypothetical protein n=1 Tax=Streptococcus pluranimalium TaxID=82348 RepID=UPI00346615B7
MIIKTLKLLSLGIFCIFLISCANQEKQRKLTVSNIVENVYFTRTTTTELKKTFGVPQKVVKHAEKVNDTYFNIPGGDVTDELNSSKTYSKDSKIDMDKYNKQFDNTEDNPFDSYYQYRGNNLGLKYVRFYIADKVVYDIEYGPVTDKLVAKKDKYLRQILD